MPQLLSGIPLSDEQRQKNDGPYRPMVVLAVLGMLLIYLLPIQRQLVRR